MRDAMESRHDERVAAIISARAELVDLRVVGAFEDAEWEVAPGPEAWAALRRALGFEAGESLVARVEEGRLVIEKAESVERRVKERYRGVKARSLADERDPLSRRAKLGVSCGVEVPVG